MWCCPTRTTTSQWILTKAGAFGDESSLVRAVTRPERNDMTVSTRRSSASPWATPPGLGPRSSLRRWSTPTHRHAPVVIGDANGLPMRPGSEIAGVSTRHVDRQDRGGVRRGRSTASIWR